MPISKKWAERKKTERKRETEALVYFAKTGAGFSWREDQASVQLNNKNKELGGPITCCCPPLYKKTRLFLFFFLFFL